jgi:hypothetical protein
LNITKFNIIFQTDFAVLETYLENFPIAFEAMETNRSVGLLA